MLSTVADFIRRHQLFAPGERVLVAVSGGADSTALLHLLVRLVPEWSLSLAAAHLDHGIRPEGRRDAAWLTALCATLDVPLTVERCAVPAVARAAGQGLEEAGREARRSFLRRVAAAQGCTAIALGHQRDDQAETVLHRLLRGSGATGLAAMWPRSGPFVRPLLEIPGATLRAWLAGQGIGWCEDTSNQDPAFTRNRIRHQLLPLLREFNPEVAAALARLGSRLALEEEYWSQQVETALAPLEKTGEAGLTLAVPALRDLHPALRARVLRRALERVRGDLRGVGADHLAALDHLVNLERPQAEACLPGLWAGRRFERLELRRLPPAPVEPFALAVPAPGRYPLPGGLILSVETGSATAEGGPWSAEFSAAGFPWPLQVRSFRPGDRLALPGGGHARVKELLRAARLTREERARLPLVAAGEVLWVPGVKSSARWRPDPAGAAVVRLVLEGWESATKSL